MVELDLDRNQLNGTIPSEFGRMSDLKELDISKLGSSNTEASFLLLNLIPGDSSLCT
jgi:hypothetical protein